jgi:hypothetical protein
MIKPTKYFKGLIVMLALTSFGFSDFELRWNNISAGLKDVDIQRIFIDPKRTDMFWISTGRAVYEVKGAGERYSFTAVSPQLTAKVNDIFLDQNAIYLATDEGLYKRAHAEYHFKRIFNSSDASERQCVSVISLNGKLFLGTRKGLFIKEAKDPSWQAIGGELSNVPLSQIVLYGETVFALNARVIYKIDPLRNSYTEIFTVGRAAEEEVDQEETDQFPEDPAGDGEAVDFKGVSLQTYYLGTQKGVYRTHDAGKTWEVLNTDGLPYTSLRRLLVLEAPDGKEPELYAATSKGVYRYVQMRWQQVYQGLESNNIIDLARDAGGSIYAATDRGLFILADKKTFSPVPVNGEKALFKDYAEIERYFSFEPSIREVQELAVEYAEVHPDKIKKWRKQAQMRAIAPSLSAGIDRSTTEMFHWDTGSNPDNLQRGREFLDWDVGFSWNLGDLIWNNDQTSIDSRSKLMVELREDVLDQVTRIYFERRRIQVDLIGQDHAQAVQKIEQQMRLAELTAIIDGFTGGKFSRRISAAEQYQRKEDQRS